jgi:hypothetical protein
MPLDEEKALTDAVEHLYKVFAGYPLAQKVEGCRHCVSPQDEAELHAKPLRQLTADDLSRYAFNAMTTFGDADDFRHFLPRLLELSAELNSISYEIDVEVIFSKLRYAEWLAWPKQEQEAVRRYFVALWQYLLTMTPEEVSLDEYLCAIGQAEDNLRPYLEVWQNTTTDAAINQLIAFVADQLSLHKRKLTNAFWSGRREQMTQVVDWLFATEMA